MKKIKETLTDFCIGLFGILLLPLILLYVVILLLWGLIRYPFCNAKYKKSHYFKDFGIKYAAFVYDSEFYRIYNAVKEAHLPLTPILCRDHKGRVIDMLFFHGQTILCVNPEEEIDYDADQNKWTAEVFNDKKDEDETVDFIDHVNKWIDDQLIAHPECAELKRRVILVQEKHISKKDLARAMETSECLLYNKDNTTEMIRRFIAEN